MIVPDAAEVKSERRWQHGLSVGERILGPMSVGQLALWMIHQRSPLGPAYNFAFAARTASTIDLSALSKACQSLVRRHPVLRTTYRILDNQPVRVLSDQVDVVIGEVDCRDWRESQVVDWIRSEADRPFDLHYGPLIRFSLIRRRTGDVLAIAMHHIAADLWSMDVLVQELIDLYAMTVGGGTIELGPLPTTYDDYVAWEHQLEESDEGQRLWQFWRDKLVDAPDVLSLPTTYPRPPEQTFNGNSVEWTVPAEVVDGLREVAHAERATMFTIVLAAYQAFLSRICNQDDLLVGTVSASRGQSDWEGLVGYFLNQLVLRTRIAGSPTYRELLRDTQREVLDALQNQAFPFAKLVQKLRPKRDASRSPLIQTMFIWDKPRHLKESHFAPGKSSDRLRLKPMLMEQRGAPFDLTLIVFELEDELKLTFRYNTDLFSKEAIRTLAESLQTLIEGIANDPDLLIRSARLLPTGQEGLIETWNDTDAEFDPNLSGDAFLRKWAAESPNELAIESPIARMTYAEVNEAAQNVADSLWQAGVRQGERVAILAERGVESIVAILAVWRAGAAYVPLDPDQPAARLQSMLDDANPRLVLVCGNPDRLNELNKRCRVLSFHDAVIPGNQASPQRQHVSPDAPAYVIYTSGSTGRPKGAVLAHRGVANLAFAQRQTFAIQKTDRCLQFASLGFDASVFEILMALHAGATLYVLDASSRRSTTTQITDTIRSASVTVATLPPTVLAALDPNGLTDLRTIISAGEVCSASIVDKWGRDREMFNAYGPTEATVWSTIERCSPDEPEPSLGRPIANVRAYIVDHHLEPTPIGVPGELCLSGPGLALEYLNLPSQSSCAFVPNPFDERFDATLYRTGDRARWTEDGKIEFLGRTDNQIKTDGNRIEPGEVAAVLNAFSDVDQAHVCAFNEEGRVVLAAYVIARSGSTPDWERSLRRRARKTLPSFMVPRHIIQVQQFPVTVHGKIDVSALPSPVVGRADVAVRSTPPSTPTQKSLAEIWCEVLGLDDIGIHDNFFDSGGASLQALGAADKAARRGFVTTAESMFRFQTIAELAADIDSRRHDLVEVSSTPGADLNPAHGSNFGAESNPGPESNPGLQSNPGVKQSPEESAGASSVAGTAQSQSHAHSEDAGQPRMVVESLGMYLPSTRVSTSEVIEQCVNRLDFPLERMTGIESRRVAGDGEFSIDLARKAADDCLRRSSVSRGEIDLLIACNISRYDGPEFQVSYEPTTASKLKQMLGIDRAIAFDICNACAGFFTALSIAEQEMLAGRARRPMIVSGEYITHLTGTAQQELDGFMDPRLACLTLGDAGVAAIVGLSEGNAGFETLELYTAGAHHDLCVAKATDGPHGGAIMLTDAIKASAVTLDHSVSHAYRVMEGHGWKPSDVQHLIMHQTSSTTLDGAVEELNRFYGDRVCDAGKTINNLTHRGNTASTTHWVAVMDAIRQGRILSGDSAAFAISGSGQTIGTALYRFDDLPLRITSDSAVGSSPAAAEGVRITGDVPRVEGTENEPAPLPSAVQLPVPRYGVKIVAANVADKVTDGDAIGKDQRLVASIENAKDAAMACLDQAGWQPAETELLIHTGVYREEYLSEPAVAAILAGELQMNHEKPDADSRTTLAFDLADSQRGPLTAICLVADAIRIGRIKRGIVTASECENNSASLPQRGLAEFGSAIALERADSAEEGLVDVWFDSHPRYADRLAVATKSIDGRPVLQIRKSADFVDSMRECVVRSVTSYLNRREETIGSFDRVLISAEIGTEGMLIAKQLGMETSRLNLAAAGDQGDPFTSGLAALWSALASESQARAPQRWLIVSAGAGIEVACATYLLKTGEVSR